MLRMYQGMRAYRKYVTNTLNIVHRLGQLFGTYATYALRTQNQRMLAYEHTQRLIYVDAIRCSLTALLIGIFSTMKNLWF